MARVPPIRPPEDAGMALRRCKVRGPSEGCRLPSIQVPDGLP